MTIPDTDYLYWDKIKLTNLFFLHKGDSFEKLNEHFVVDDMSYCSFSIEFIKNKDVELYTVPNVYYKYESKDINENKYYYFELPKTKVIEIKFIKDDKFFLESYKIIKREKILLLKL